MHTNVIYSTIKTMITSNIRFEITMTQGKIIEIVRDNNNMHTTIMSRRDIVWFPSVKTRTALVQLTVILRHSKSRHQLSNVKYIKCVIILNYYYQVDRNINGVLHENRDKHYLRSNTLLRRHCDLEHVFTTAQYVNIYLRGKKKSKPTKRLENIVLCNSLILI